jgi:hypothetical protein
VHEELHTEETKPTLPALPAASAVQSEQADAPANEYVLISQLVHVLDPALAAMDPAGQVVQDELPATEVYPAGQAKHVPAVVAVVYVFPSLLRV